MPKKNKECSSCNDLLVRLERLENRLDHAEEDSAHWKKRWQLVDEDNRKLRCEISLLKAENLELRRTISKKDAQLVHLQKLLFADKSEVSQGDQFFVDVQEQELVVKPKLKRGKQPGSQGFGRKRRSDLPIKITEHDVRKEDKSCPKCGCERCLSPFTEDSEEITYRLRLLRIVHKRRKYKKTCRCSGVPEFVTAPVPPKLIPKGLFSSEFWAFILLEKFLLQRPLSRICLSLKLHGLTVSSGTLTSGLKKLTKLFAPLYNSMRNRVRASSHWQMDETHWRVFVDEMGKSNHKWWLWIADTRTVSVFTLDPTRSSDVPVKLLKDIPAGILTCDRYSSYKPLLQQGIQLSYCWAHLRRDFLNLRDGYPCIAPLAQSWVERINDVFHTNKLRLLEQQDSKTYCQIQAKLEKLILKMFKDATRFVRQSKLTEEALAVFKSLLKHWTGLTIFVKLPHVPMDNNASERALRNPVVGRKNYYGSRSIWGGHLAAMLFSLFKTLEKQSIDPLAYLTKYLRACVVNRCRPPTDLKEFTPWDKDPSEPISPEMAPCMVY